MADTEEDPFVIFLTAFNLECYLEPLRVVGYDNLDHLVEMVHSPTFVDYLVEDAELPREDAELLRVALLMLAPAELPEEGALNQEAAQEE